MEDLMNSRKIVVLVCVVLVTALAAGFLGGCASASKVDVYYRKDVNTSASKVIAFPMLLWDGKKLSKADSYDNPVADALIGKKWTEYLGTENAVTVPRQALDKLPGAWNAIDTLVKVLDKTSAVEQTGSLRRFLNAVGSKFGDGALAFALVTKSKEEFENAESIRVSMGLFDTKKLTWKWITHTTSEKGMIPIPYEKVVQDMIKASFDSLKEKSGGPVR